MEQDEQMGIDGLATKEVVLRSSLWRNGIPALGNNHEHSSKMEVRQ